MKSLSGQTFDRWTVLEYAGRASSRPTAQTLWLCRCQCGTKKKIQYGSLVGRTSTSCGCYRAEATGNRFRKKTRIVRTRNSSIGKKKTARNKSVQIKKKRVKKLPKQR